MEFLKKIEEFVQIKQKERIQERKEKHLSEYQHFCNEIYALNELSIPHWKLTDEMIGWFKKDGYDVKESGVFYIIKSKK